MSTRMVTGKQTGILVTAAVCLAVLARVAPVSTGPAPDFQFIMDNLQLAIAIVGAGAIVYLWPDF